MNGGYMGLLDDNVDGEKVEWKKLGEVCEFRRGQAITKKDIIDGKIPVIAGGQKPAYYNGISNRNGITIAIAGSGAYAGFVSYWEQPIFLSDAFSVEPNESLNKRYLYHWLLGIQHKIFELKQGSGIPHVYGKDLGRFEIPIPSIETQKKIVEILDKFTNYVTELQVELQARTKQYEYYRNMLLSEEYLTKKARELCFNNFVVREVKLKNICKILSGGDKPKAYISKYKVGQWNMPIIGNGVGKNAILGYTNSYGKIKEESVTVSARGTIGYAEYRDYEYYPVVRLIVLISENKNILNTRYLYYCMSIQRYKLPITGGIPQLTIPIISEKEIFLPPLLLQEKIVEILDKFQALVEDARGALPAEIEARQKEYEYYREKLLTFNGLCVPNINRTLTEHYIILIKQAADKVGVDISELFNLKNEVIRLDFVALKNISNIILGGTPSKTNNEYWENGDIPWLNSGEVNKKNIYYADNYITKKGYKNSSATFVPADSTVIALAGQGKTRGMVARLKIKATTNQSLATIIPNKNLNNDFLYFYLTSKYDLLRKISSGSGTRGGLNKEILSNIPIPLPPLSVQNHVASTLDKFDTLVNDIKVGIPAEIELIQKKYEYYREKLLSFNK